MPLTEHARRYLIAEGIPPETIIKTGSPMREVLNFNKDSIQSQMFLNKEFETGRIFYSKCTSGGKC